MANTAVNLSAQ